MIPKILITKAEPGETIEQAGMAAIAQLKTSRAEFVIFDFNGSPIMLDRSCDSTVAADQFHTRDYLSRLGAFLRAAEGIA